MYLIYDTKPGYLASDYPKQGYLGYCTRIKNWTTQPKASDVLKAFSFGMVTDAVEFHKLLEYVTKHNLPLVHVYDENFKEIPVATFINDNPELFI